MTVQPGTHRLGPDNATLAVRTGRAGAASKAGHDLLIAVTSWEGTLTIGDDPDQTVVELTADATSLSVREGKGGVKALGDGDKASIEQTIDDDVLKREDIAFRSTEVTGSPGDPKMRVEGDLTLVGTTRPIGFDLSVGEDGSLSATAVVKQTDWGMKPYSALFGALKVADEVEVVLEGHLRERP